VWGREGDRGRLVGKGLAGGKGVDMALGDKVEQTSTPLLVRTVVL